MKLKHILPVLFAVILTAFAQAEYISDSSSSNSWGENLSYTIPPVEDGPSYDQIWFTGYSYSAWYDTDTGEGYYGYVVWNQWQYVGIEMVASGGVWTQTSYAGEMFFAGPSFTQYFWNEVIGPPVWP
jgi:hypothetical protein